VTHFPVRFLRGLRPIETSRLPFEVLAGVTLACLAIPEVMGYAKIAGMPVISGVYTLVFPLALYALLGSSRHLVVGADSATAAIVYASLAEMAAVGSAQYAGLAGTLAVMVGVLLLLARVLRLGFIADFLSRTVLTGFLTGVGIQVACGQLPGLLGIPVTARQPIGQLIQAFQNIGHASRGTGLVSLSIAAVLLGGPLLSTRVPWALVAIVGSLVVSRVGSLSSHGIATLGSVPSGLPSLAWPHVTVGELSPLLGAAFSIFVGAGTGILVAMILSLLTHVRHSYRPAAMLLIPSADGAWKVVKLETLAEARPGLLIYRFSANLYYANSSRFSLEVRYLAEHSPSLRWLCVLGDAVEDIDFTASATVREIQKELSEKGVSLVLIGVLPEVRAQLDRDGLTERIGRDHIFDSVGETVRAYSALHPG
jgi:MFS superfamily sulfate permease-like transporter